MRGWIFVIGWVFLMAVVLLDGGVDSRGDLLATSFILAGFVAALVWLIDWERISEQ
ncbi:MAG: hypothetical protein OXC55_01430 [Chloroflexi bacterium]|nr:hypothetical protein [Chloroflexota bacterium]